MPNLAVSVVLTLVLSIALAKSVHDEPEVAKAAKFKVEDCLLLSAMMKVHITKSNSDVKSDSVFTTYINSTNVDKITSSGICGDKFNLLSLKGVPEDSVLNWSLSLNFSHPQPGYYGLSNIFLDYKLENADASSASSDKLIFSCAMGSSFMCISEQTYELKDKLSNSTNIRLTVTDLQVEAFRNNGSSPEFTGPHYSCSADYVPTKVIPIVVGILLVIMIVVALIAFIIGSRRRQVGYQEI
ncbi:unnamed protein product [Trichobilharzia szidati]|nr:unnamed protein product [Trichobilharzia szidati]